jgi:hypothetical protein
MVISAVATGSPRGLHALACVAGLLFFFPFSLLLLSERMDDYRTRRKTCCTLHCRSAMLRSGGPAVLLVQLRFSNNTAAARDGFSRCPIDFTIAHKQYFLCPIFLRKSLNDLRLPNDLDVKYSAKNISSFMRFTPHNWTVRFRARIGRDFCLRHVKRKTAGRSQRFV